MAEDDPEEGLEEEDEFFDTFYSLYESLGDLTGEEQLEILKNMRSQINRWIKDVKDDYGV